MEYYYQGLDATGVKVKSSIEAGTLDEAKKKLKSQGIIYSQLSMTKNTTFLTFLLPKRAHLSLALLAVMSRDLAVYLNAGIPLVRSLGLMKHQAARDTDAQSFFQTLITSIHEGKSFAQSLESQEVYRLPTFYIGTLKISEDRGILAAVLGELSSYLLMQEKINKQLKQAMVYPIFIIVISLFMISFMLSVVVPKITSVFETTGQALPMLTQVVIGLSGFFANYWLLLLILLVTIVSLFGFKIANDQQFKRRIHRILLAIPIVGSMIETADLARFCTISALLIRSGIPVVNTIRLASITLSSEVIKEVFVHASSKVVEGTSLSKALGNNGVYDIDASFVEAIAIGEETSEVASMLEHLSGMYVESNKDKITVFLAVFEPALMLIIGSAIGVIVTAMLLPIFSLNLG